MWIFQYNFLCIYSGWKYRFCENFNQIGPVDFELALNPQNSQNHNIIHTDIFVTTFVGSEDFNSFENSKLVIFTIIILSPYIVSQEVKNGKWFLVAYSDSAHAESTSSFSHKANIMFIIWE